MSTEIEVNMTLFKNENFDTFTFVVITCSTLNLRTFSQILATVIKIFSCSILYFQMYIDSLNGKYKMVLLNCS